MDSLGTVVLATVGFFLVTAFVILVLPVIAGMGVIPSSTSTMITSAGTAYNELIPIIGVMVAVASIGFALAKR